MAAERGDDQQTESDDDDDSAVAFLAVDLSGVNFDEPAIDAENANGDRENDQDETTFLSLERNFVYGEFTLPEEESISSLRNLGELMAAGQYAEILRSESANDFFLELPFDHVTKHRVAELIREQVFRKGISVKSCIEMEMIGIAALNLFLQANYTGPAVLNDEPAAECEPLSDINPHPCWKSKFQTNNQLAETTETCESKEEKMKQLTTTRRSSAYQNAILSELAVEGEWPCQVCSVPYFLLVARSILLALANPSRWDWTSSQGVTKQTGCEAESCAEPSKEFVLSAAKLAGAKVWCARAAVAHRRLIPSKDHISTLWDEAQEMFRLSVELLCSSTSETCEKSAVIFLEYGLAENHFELPGKGKKLFQKAQERSGLTLEVTGAVGKRTKFQKNATAQMLVKATSVSKQSVANASISTVDENVKDVMVKHSEEEILLERIKFDDDKENEITHLSVLDQAIVLAMCLDVKNNNPADGLTAEQMGAFLARVLDHHDDWMVYSTALLERAWLEFERSHGRERAILQIQALVDQHTERLTITQSTKKSIEESAPVQERLKMLQTIVYPPRWSIISDLADRYANLGIVTSAAELFTQVEMWDDVVDCYRRAGKVPLAEKIVRERLDIQETPRMWSALGDLTGDHEHYRRAIELSMGRFSAAYVSLGHFYFDKGDLASAAENYAAAVKVRPLSPFVWFRLGTVTMQLGRWEEALRAFSEVVQQEPEEAEAWANVAAIHMRNKKPAEAYPALVESLKYSRNNWRVWVSKLYTCLDIAKYDEAVQACNTILDLRAQRQASDGVPPLEEKCVRGIVGGALEALKENQTDLAAKQACQRTLTRVYDLLLRLSSNAEAEPWVFETLSYLQELVGQDDEVLETLMKEYRALQSVAGWEKDEFQVQKVVSVVSHIVNLHTREGSRESLGTARLLLRGVIKKATANLVDEKDTPDGIKRLQGVLEEVDSKIKALT